MRFVWDDRLVPAKFSFRVSGNLEAGDLQVFVGDNKPRIINPRSTSISTNERDGIVMEYPFTYPRTKNIRQHSVKFEVKTSPRSLAGSKQSHVYTGRASIRWDISLYAAVRVFYDLSCKLLLARTSKNVLSKIGWWLQTGSEFSILLLILPEAFIQKQVRCTTLYLDQANKGLCFD